MKLRCMLKWAALTASLAGCGGMRYGFPPAIIVRGPAETIDSDAVVLEDVATLEYRVMNLPEARGPKLVAVLDHRRRYQVLREAGLAAADVELPMDGFSTITRVIARSVGRGGSEHWMSNGAIQSVYPEAANERAGDIKTIHFHIPDGEVGGLLEYRYERVYVDPELVPPWQLGDRYPIVRAEFGLVVNPKVKVDYRYGHADRIVDRAPMLRKADDGQDRQVFIESDLPAYFEEPLMPHATRSMPWIAVSLRAQRLDGSQERTDTWKDVGESVVRRMVRVQGRAGSGTLVERYAHVRDKLRPLTLPGVGVRPPVTSGDALLHGAPACSRDATSMVLQAFGGVQVKAFPALINAPISPQMLFDFPAAYPFARVVAAVEMSADMRREQTCDAADLLAQGPLCGVPVGSFIFLDPTCNTCPFGTLPAELRGGRALILGKEVHWVDVPLDRPQQNVQLATHKLELDVVGALKGTAEVELRGTQAASVRASLRAADAADAADAVSLRIEALRVALQGEGKGAASLSGYKLGDPNNADAPLHVYADLAAQAERLDYERFRVRATQLVGSSVHAIWQQGSRRTDALIDGPRWLESNAEVTLPIGYSAQIRPPLQISKPYAEYAAGFALHGRVLKFSRRLVLKTNVVKSESWADFQDFLTSIHDYEQDGPLVYGPE